MTLILIPGRALDALYVPAVVANADKTFTPLDVALYDFSVKEYSVSIDGPNYVDIPGSSVGIASQAERDAAAAMVAEDQRAGSYLKVFLPAGLDSKAFAMRASTIVIWREPKGRPVEAQPMTTPIPITRSISGGERYTP